jgi:D-xylose transport system substrate-binding protein
MTPRLALMLLSLALSVALGSVLARRGPAGSPASEESSGASHKIVIGLSLDTLSEARWQRDRDLMKARAEALGAELLVQSANSDDTRQLSDVQGLLTRRVNVLIIAPHDATAMAKAVAIAHDSNVPVISYDRLIRDSDVDLYVSFDNVRVGELQARYLVDHLPTPGKGRIVRIYGAKSDNNARLFKDGQDDVLAPYLARHDVEVIHEDWAEDWKPDVAKKIVNAAISQHGTQFDGILASNDSTAGGAIQALSEEGIVGKVVTGQDADLVACQRIVAGTQAMTVYKPLERIATAAIELAVRMATGRPIVAKQTVNNGKVDVPAVLADVVVATRDNLLDTVVRDGFHSRQDVYGAAP